MAAYRKTAEKAFRHPATRNIGVAVITCLDRDDANLKILPPTVPIIHKNASFGDDLTKALQDDLIL